MFKAVSTEETKINLDSPGNFSYFLNMSPHFIQKLSAVVLTIVLSLCLPMAASPLYEGSSSEKISDIDVCDEDSPEIFYTYLSVPEGFYLIVNFSAAGYFGNRPQHNAVLAVSSPPEKPPAS